MKKVKLLALVYSLEEKVQMLSWADTTDGVEIVQASEVLEVPLQSAVSHFSQTPDIDGLLIDDHQVYDPIVLERIKDCLKISGLSLYSMSYGCSPVIKYSHCTNFKPASIMLFENENKAKLKSISASVKLAV